MMAAMEAARPAQSHECSGGAEALVVVAEGRFRVPLPLPTQLPG
jgi:hypothetical protein